MTSRVLITGATGFLGSHLYQWLSARGTPVVGQGFATASDFQGDLGDAQQTEKILSAARPAVILNLVALADVDRCESNPALAHRLNVRVVKNLAQWVAGHEGTRLVHVSTDQVYDGPGPHAEDDVAPCNLYGYSKYCAELVAAKVGATVLRTNFFGHNARSGSSFCDWLLDSIRRRAPIRLYTDALFSPLFLGTLAEVLERVLRAPRPGIYNLGSRDGMSKRDFSHALAGHFGLDISAGTDALRNDDRSKARRPGDMRMISARFEKAYGCTLPSLADEILRMKNEYAAKA